MTLHRVAVVSALITSLSAGSLLGEERDSNTMNLMDDKNPPVAKIVPHPVTLHGDTRADDYFWLRDDDRQNPEVLGYLEAENNYTARVMKPTEALQQRLFEEIKGRVKETDLTVPYLDHGYFYYSRTEEGKQYPIYVRKAGSQEAPEVAYCDLNELARGHDFFSLGVKSVSPDGNLMAYSTDTDGSESYQLQFRDLTGGRTYPETMTEVDNVAWANDSRHLFYTTRDEAKRTYRVWRNEVGAPVTGDVLLYQEDDALYDIFLSRTLSDGFIVFGSASSTTSECRIIPA
ncbi:MAG: oligopeptidase B, partial [bacterium]